MLAADNLEIVDDSMLFTKRNLFLDVFMHRGKQEYSQVHVITMRPYMVMQKRRMYGIKHFCFVSIVCNKLKLS